MGIPLVNIVFIIFWSLARTQSFPSANFVRRDQSPGAWFLLSDAMLKASAPS
jgi:hypothetical protein